MEVSPSKIDPREVAENKLRFDVKKVDLASLKIAQNGEGI